MNKRPLLWVSVLRIFAALCIYLFHFFVLNNDPTYDLALIGLSIFFFLAGWFSGYSDRSPQAWIVRRLRALLMPYWSVIFVVLVANRVVGYKETTILKDIMIFLGLSFFLKNPVYIISWFITVIMILYSSIFVFRIIRSKTLGYLFLTLFCAVFCYLYPVLWIEVVLFYAGFLLTYGLNANEAIKVDFLDNVKIYNVINDAFYKVQNYSYSFFLIHPAALIYVFYMLKLRSMSALAVSFLLTVIGSFAHREIIKRYI